MDTQPATVTRERTQPEWLPRLLDWLQGLRQVKENWDGYHADAPRPEMIEAASDFIRALAERLPIAEPNAYPTRTGGVQFAWEHGPHQVEVEFDPEGPNSFLYLNAETDEGIEKPLPIPFYRDAEIMSRLGHFEV